MLVDMDNNVLRMWREGQPLWGVEINIELPQKTQQTKDGVSSSGGREKIQSQSQKRTKSVAESAEERQKVQTASDSEGADLLCFYPLACFQYTGETALLSCWRKPCDWDWGKAQCGCC